MKTYLILITFTLSSILSGVGQVATVDYNYGDSGHIVGNSFSQQHSRILVQKDGKQVCTSVDEFYGSGVVLMRLAQDGQLDTTFGNNGTVQNDSGNNYVFWASALTTQEDFIVGGHFSGGQGPTIVVGKYLNNGMLDTTFGDQGYFTRNMNTQSTFSFYDQAFVEEVLVQKDGKIIVAGFHQVECAIFFGWGCGVGMGGGGSLNFPSYTTSCTQTNFFALRLLPNGELDSTYADNGINENIIGDSNLIRVMHSAKLQDDGKLIVGGTSETFWNPNLPSFTLARLDTNGQLDTTFNGTGYIHDNVSLPFEDVRDLLIQQDGKIVTAVQTFDSVRLYRFSPLGVFDSTFGVDGIVHGPDSIWQLNWWEGNTSVIEQLDESIIVVCGDQYKRVSKDGDVSANCGHGVYKIPNFFAGANYVQLQGDTALYITSLFATFVIKLNVPSNATYLTKVSCDSFNVGNLKYEESGNYIARIQNGYGCDSVVFLELTVHNMATTEHSGAACGEYTFNGITYNETGQFDQMYQTQHGCDSIVELDLTIYPIHTTTIVEQACDELTFNGTVYNNTGVYHDTLQTIHGCDSVIDLDLTINSADAQIMQNWDSLISVNTGNSYQWINCASGIMVTGANQATFTPDSNGLYALVLTENGCTDTSDCIDVSNLGLKENAASSFAVYPNPSNGLFNIALPNDLSNAVIEVHSSTGQIVYQTTTNHTNLISFNLNQPQGVYLLTIKNNSSAQTRALIIN